MRRGRGRRCRRGCCVRSGRVVGTFRRTTRENSGEQDADERDDNDRTGEESDSLSLTEAREPSVEARSSARCPMGATSGALLAH